MTGRTDRAIFLDRDGTLIHNRHYGCDPDQIEIVDGVLEALRLFQRDGYQLIVVTNQSGIARGFFTEERLHAMHRRLAELFASSGVSIDGFYYCPHHVEGTVAAYSHECDCRKPKPGMILRACREHAIDPQKSWMIGDILDDVEAGKTAGCRSVLIDLGTERAPETWARTPEFVARDLLDAARYILSPSNRRAQEVTIGY